MNELPKGVSIRWEPMSAEDMALIIRYYDDFRLPDGREFRLYGEEHGQEPAIDAAGVWLTFPSQAHAERAWVDLQAMFGVRGTLASHPDWDGLFPEPSEPSIQ